MVSGLFQFRAIRDKDRRHEEFKLLDLRMLHDAPKEIADGQHGPIHGIVPEARVDVGKALDEEADLLLQSNGL